MMGLETEIARLSQELGDALMARGWLAATAESCTGGGVATAITDIAGSSRSEERRVGKECSEPCGCRGGGVV